MLNIKGNTVPVTHSLRPNIEEAIKTDLLRNWSNSIDPSINVKNVEIQSVDHFSSSRIGFVGISADAEYKGSKIPGTCVLRGGSVVILVEITDEDNGEKYSVLTIQPRLPSGTLINALPAGMIDGNGMITGVAVKELEEECGLVAREEDLLNLTLLAYGDKYLGMYSCPSVVDEFLVIYLWRTRMAHDKIIEINGRIGGEDEHEQIKLKLVKYNEIWKCYPDSMTLAALYLKQQLEESGKI